MDEPLLAIPGCGSLHNLCYFFPFSQLSPLNATGLLSLLTQKGHFSLSFASCVLPLNLVLLLCSEGTVFHVVGYLLCLVERPWWFSLCAVPSKPLLCLESLVVHCNIGSTTLIWEIRKAPCEFPAFLCSSCWMEAYCWSVLYLVSGLDYTLWYKVLL